MTISSTKKTVFFFFFPSDRKLGQLDPFTEHTHTTVKVLSIFLREKKICEDDIDNIKLLFLIKIIHQVIPEKQNKMIFFQDQTGLFLTLTT